MIRTMIRQKQIENPTALEKIRLKDDPFMVLISTILSSRTKDKITLQASRRLFSRFKDANALADANEDHIRELIRPVGFYITKASRIKEVARIIVTEYEGDVPANIDNLLDLPSVGRKTANCVLVYAFGIPAIPVDTHVHRISNRLGIVETDAPEETEHELSNRINKRYWLEINELFVKFGQEICKPINPLCDTCLLLKMCPYGMGR